MKYGLALNLRGSFASAPDNHKMVLMAVVILSIHSLLSESLRAIKW